MKTVINDGDYILADGRAWFEYNGFSIRISTDYDGSKLGVDIWKIGEEDGDPIAQTYVNKENN